MFVKDAFAIKHAILNDNMTFLCSSWHMLFDPTCWLVIICHSVSVYFHMTLLDMYL